MSGTGISIPFSRPSQHLALAPSETKLIFHNAHEHPPIGLLLSNIQMRPHNLLSLVQTHTAQCIRIIHLNSFHVIQFGLFLRIWYLVLGVNNWTLLIEFSLQLSI
jgi:hypothetical protein